MPKHTKAKKSKGNKLPKQPVNPEKITPEPRLPTGFATLSYRIVPPYYARFGGNNSNVGI